MQKPLVQNAASEKQIKNASQKERNLQETLLNDLIKLLKQPEFRRFAWRYLADARVFAQTFDHSGSVTAFNEGKRAIGLKLLGEIVAASPESYLQMMKENQEGDF